MVTTLRKVRASGFQVVVVAVHTHRRERVDLLLGQHAQRAGNLDVDLVADRLDAGGDLRQQALIGSAYGRDDAELGGAGLGGLLGGLHQARNVQPSAADRRREQTRLGAEVAVLRAAARLQADDALDLDLRSAPAHAHFMGQRQQLVKAIVGQPQNGQHLVLGQTLSALEHLLAGQFQDVGHVVLLGSVVCSSRKRLIAVSALRASGSSPTYLNGVQVRVKPCSCTNATWSTRRPRYWTLTGSPT